MSHFTKLDRANITDPGAFMAACKELGFDKITDGRTANTKPTIRGYHGNKTGVDIAVEVPDEAYDFGLKKGEGNKWDLVSDWMMFRVPGFAQQKVGGNHGQAMANALIRTTTKHALIANYRRQGFTARVSEDAQHNIQLTLTRA